MKSNNKRHILLAQLFSNGDCLYATTVARQIKQDYPDCHLTWAISPSCKNIIVHNPHVDDIKIIATVAKNDTKSFRTFKNRLQQELSQGIWDKVFITHIMDENLAYYDGCIRSNIFRAYPNAIKVDSTPQLFLHPEEKNKAEKFVTDYNLLSYNHRILFEFAPQSGQVPINIKDAVAIAEELTRNSSVAVILSSANKINHPNKNIIDGSSLTLRETAALTHFCTLLIGCSSGITWISTSSAAKLLPMIQLVDPKADWCNPVSRDFKRLDKSTEGIIDLIHFDIKSIVQCVRAAMEDFIHAKTIFSEKIPVHFNTTRKIVYNLLCYLHFRAIFTHIQINRKVWGNDMRFYFAVFFALCGFPFKLIRNFISKKILN